MAIMAFTDRGDGDFHVDGPSDELTSLRQRTMTGEWSWLRQVHGDDVVTVSRIGEGAGAIADAAVTATPGAVLAVQTADCVPVVLVGGGVVGVAHAGWRGLVAGVIPATVDRMRALGATSLSAVIGPCIRPGDYEFGAADLDSVAAATSEAARSVTDTGATALDMAAATTAALAAAGVDHVSDLGQNTAEERFHSHRVRGDTGRQATVVRLEANP